VNILFISYGDFRANSLTHIAGFAAGLVRRHGHDCAVTVPRRLKTFKAVPDPAFRPLLYSDVLRRPACFADGRPADIIHAWTPRHLVATCVLSLQRRMHRAARLVVHLEDNEEHLASHIGGLPFDTLRSASPGSWQKLFDRELIHPWRHRLLLHAADAVTHITPSLARFIPSGTPGRLLLPGVDPAFLTSETPDLALKHQLGLPPGARILVYPGSVNPVNAAEIRDLYQAVALLNRDGPHPVRLVRTGASSKWFIQSLTPSERETCINLGFIDRRRLPALLRLADVLVQPGKTGPFNDYRLPSKLAEFLASGRPVIMPAANIAAELAEGRDALFLRDGTPEDIAGRCRTVFADSDLATRLGRHGREAARRLFDTDCQSDRLAALYAEVASRPARADWPAFAAAPALDERTLFAPDPADPDLVATLRWTSRFPRPAPADWRRHLPAWLYRAQPDW
jgi:glycosyltransferase involved in cell wall biosynthesis